jgi:hypothetical protein
MQHSPIVDYQRVSRTSECDRQRFGLCEPLADQVVRGLANPACRPEKYFVPPENIHTVGDGLIEAQKFKSPFPWPTRLEDGASQDISGDGGDERTTVKH